MRALNRDKNIELFGIPLLKLEIKKLKMYFVKGAEKFNAEFLDNIRYVTLHYIIIYFPNIFTIGSVLTT